MKKRKSNDPHNNTQKNNDYATRTGGGGWCLLENGKHLTMWLNICCVNIKPEVYIIHHRLLLFISTKKTNAKQIANTIFFF